MKNLRAKARDNFLTEIQRNWLNELGFASRKS